jgi:predicted RNA binding protein with dsRBD fold (UPF0201 family)
MGIKVEIRARVYPTEDVNKVKRAILNIFPDAILRVEGDFILGETTNLENFAELLKEQRIRDSARRVLLGNFYDDKIEFEISKQAAFVGKVSFSVGNVALGNIKIRVKGDNLEALIDRIAPDTRAL